MKSKIILVACSLTLIPIWGLGLLHISVSNWYTVLMTFLITGLCLSLIPIFDVKNVKDKVLILIGPIIYFVVSLILIDLKEHLTFPITWIFLMTLLLVLVIKNQKLKVAITFLFGLSYTFLVYSEQTLYDTESPVAKNIFDFKFIDNQSDTVYLRKNKKPILIETWNENCPSCIKSIRDLGEELSNNSDFDFYYLYQQNGQGLSLNEILKFKPLSKHKENIIIDIKNTLFDSLALNAYPYFLIFDANGELRGHQAGYNPKMKNEKLEELELLIEDARKPERNP